MRRLVPLVLAPLILAACSSAPEPVPETREQRRVRCEKALVASGDKDPWAFFELGQIDEEEGELEKAVEDYGSAVALLPARSVTRPALSLARVHAKLGHWDPARRMYEEVLETVAVDARYYRENPDYRAAALGLKEVFEHRPDVPAASRVRERFLGELGGKASDWPSTN